MLTLEGLKNLGVNTDEGLERCLDDEEFYLSLVEVAPEEEELNKLDSELKNGNIQSAFEVAHALKGVYGNMALTPLYKPMVQLTEILRNNSTDNSDILMKEIKENFAKLSALL